jgi:hypothetical protein
MATVKMNLAAIGGTVQLPFTGNVTVPADGIVTVDQRDALDLLRAGASYISASVRSTYVGAPAVGAAGQFVASASLSNGTLTIAHQPDAPRLASIRIDPGTAAISAGNVAVSYIGNDGQAIVDNISAVTGATTIVSTNTSRGVVHLTSVVVTGVSGGASPGVQMDSLNSLAVLVDPGFVDFTALKATVDNADSGIASVQSTAACITPSTAPNATHTYNLVASYNAPNT